VIDHITGSRRGQRQELAPEVRVTFGRHPDNQVTFDAHRDLDASSRHAELRKDGEDRFHLVDIGSSNGTFIDGQRVKELELPIGRPVEVEFGSGGPRLRLFIGDDDQVAELPGIETTVGELPGAGGGRAVYWLLAAVALSAVIGLMWWRFAG
jgi:hypothetical protein